MSCRHNWQLERTCVDCYPPLEVCEFADLVKLCRKQSFYCTKCLDRRTILEGIKPTVAWQVSDNTYDSDRSIFARLTGMHQDTYVDFDNVGGLPPFTDDKSYMRVNMEFEESMLTFRAE